jgi:hypothetical protein
MNYAEWKEWTSPVLTPEKFAVLHPTMSGNFGASEGLYIESAQSGRPPTVLFWKRLIQSEAADVDSDYLRVYVADINGTLRTSAKTLAERSFVEALFAAALPIIEQKQIDHVNKVRRARTRLPKVDPGSLKELVTAMTHGKVDSLPIVNAVLLAATDPDEYIAANAALCEEYDLSEPQTGMHIIAFMQHLPPPLRS